MSPGNLSNLFWGQKVKGQGHKTKPTDMGLCTLVSAGFSSYITVGRKFRDLYGTFEAFG